MDTLRICEWVRINLNGPVDKTESFDLPSAFSRAFCSRCGSPLPHLTRSGREIIVPAGSLDGEPPLQPQCHAHWSSRASWTCSGDHLPRFPEAPEVTKKS